MVPEVPWLPQRLFISCSWSTGLLLRLHGPAWLSSSQEQCTSGHALLVAEGKKQDTIEFKASPLMWQVSHMFTFSWRKQVPWLVWTVGPEVFSAHQDALRCDKGGCAVPLGMGMVGGVSVTLEELQSAPSLGLGKWEVGTAMTSVLWVFDIGLEICSVQLSVELLALTASI